MTQKAIFPMWYLRITQDENGSYSHLGSKAHDHGGRNGSSDDVLFAPYDGTAARVRQDSSHETYFASDDAVETPRYGVCVLTTTLMHDNVLDVFTGKRLKQFEKVGDEGGFGRGKKDAFAHHAHIEVSKGRQTTQTRNANGTYCTPNQIALYDAFFLHPDTMVYTKAANGVQQWVRAGDCAGGKVTDTCGHVWTVATELDKPSQPTTPALDPAKPVRLTVTAGNCEFFAARNLDKSVGKLAQGTAYNVREYYPEAVQVAGMTGRWVRFALANGEEYFCLVLPDRASLANVWTPAVGDTVRATANVNVRSAPSVQHLTVGGVATGETVTLAEIADGWGFVKGKGWVCLDYMAQNS